MRQSGGGASTSRFGLTGVEDLGGGTSTKFVLESGFSPADGSFQGGTLFYRRAYVSLQNTRYGDLRLGRQYTPAFYVVYDGDPFGLNERLSPLALRRHVDGHDHEQHDAADSASTRRRRT
ncbi:outer membrane porin protein precursor [Burkholderia cenocepacia]|uniref:porin n=1 Tax=Burkholderia cenocepacia TaxID=95486 RepID=UPI0018619FAA|nr:porin [Burkholderia cenocepacia]QND97738.1 outer membrane porin protein precursor [Burkholderia cenocepacia]